MKTSQVLKYSLLFFLAFAFGIANAALDEKSKQIHKSYAISAQTVLRIDNSFGKIQLNNWNKNEFKVDIEVKVQGRNDDRAEKLLRAVKVNISEREGIISFQTDIESKLNTKGEESFEINYTVFLPESNHIEIRNQFGDTYIQQRSGDADIEVKFGNLKTEDFTGSLELDISFGNAYLGNTNKSEISVKYGELEMGDGQEMDMEQQFSDVSIGNFGDIRLESKYGEVYIGNVDYLDGEIQFSELRIKRIEKQVEIEGSYISDFEIETLSKEFTLCRIYSKFSDLEINLEEGLKANIEADMSFCKLKDYTEVTDFYYQSNEDNRKEYKGRINGGEATKEIVIRSSYGDVKLNKEK